MSHIRTLIVRATRSGAIATAVISRGVPQNGGVGDVAGNTVAAAAKTTPVDADLIPLVDSEASNVLKKLTWANLKATAKAYFDTLYASSTKFIAGAGALTGPATTLTIGTAAGYDAATFATPNTVVLRGANGEASFGDSTTISFSGNGISGESYSGIGIAGYSITGFGLHGVSSSGTGLRAVSEGGTNHAEFGWDVQLGEEDNRLFIRRVLGLIGWHRGAYVQTIGSPATLSQDSELMLPDAATGTFALLSDIPPGGGWDGDIADIDLDGGTDIGADLVDADLMLVDDGAAGANRKSAISRLWTYIKAKIDAGQTWAGVHAFSSTTRPTSSGTGAPAATSLITRGDFDLLIPRWRTFNGLVTTTNVSSGNSFYMNGRIAAATAAISASSTLNRLWQNNGAPLWAAGVAGSAESTTANQVAWTRKIAIAFDLFRSVSNATCITAFQVGRPQGETNVTDLVSTNKAVAIKIENYDVKLQVADGTTLATSATLATLANLTWASFVLVIQSGTATLFIDGVSVGSLAGAPTTLNTGFPNTAANGMHFSVANNGTATAVSCSLSDPKILVE